MRDLREAEDFAIWRDDQLIWINMKIWITHLFLRNLKFEWLVRLNKFENWKDSLFEKVQRSKLSTSFLKSVVESAQKLELSTSFVTILNLKGWKESNRVFLINILEKNI